MTRQEAESLGYVVETRTNPPEPAVVTLRRGTTNAPWLAVEQTLDGPGLGGLNDVLDVLVSRINAPIPEEPVPPAPQSPMPSNPQPAPNNAKADTLLTVWVDGLRYELLARVAP